MWGKLHKSRDLNFLCTLLHQREIFANFQIFLAMLFLCPISRSIPSAASINRFTLRKISMLSTTDHGLSGTLFAFPSSSKCVGTQSIAVISSVRQLSTRDIFFRDLPAELTSRIPDPPVPVPKPSLVEMISSGQSVLDELELWSWWKPSSWLRYGMEMAHLSLDLPWWATIIACEWQLNNCF